MKSFRVPVLEKYPWQEPIKKVINELPRLPEHLDRYIIGTSPNPELLGKTNNIVWYNREKKAGCIIKVKKDG